MNTDELESYYIVIEFPVSKTTHRLAFLIFGNITKIDLRLVHTEGFVDHTFQIH